MTMLKELSEALYRYVHPQTYPIAIKLCTSKDEVPKEAMTPIRNFGKQMPVCQAFGVSRRLGYIMAVGLEDQQCPTGNLALGFLPPKKEFLDGSFHWSFLPTEDANRAYAQSIRMLEFRKYRYLLIAPIGKAEFEPNMVAIFGNPAQVVRMVQARLYMTGGMLNASACLGVTCSLIVSHTILDDECKFVLIGSGPRRFAHDQDHEMVFTIPSGKFDLIFEGLHGCEENTNYRIPTPLWMDYEIEMPPHYKELQKFLKSSE